MIGGSNLDEVDSLDNQSGHPEGKVRDERLRGDGLKAFRRNRIRVEIAVLTEWSADTHDPVEVECVYIKPQKKLVCAMERAEAYEPMCDLCDLPRF